MTNQTNIDANVPYLNVKTYKSLYFYMQSVHILKLIMKVRKSVANTNKNSLLMFSEKLPREVDELPSSFRQNHLKRKSFISEFSIDRIHSLHKPVAIVWTKLFTGSSYFGRWNQFGFNGHGIYRFPDGLTYDGELKDGHFHGDGTLTFPDGNEIIGSWEKGVNQYMSLRFLDRLMFKEKDWDYCMSPDRRCVSCACVANLEVLTTRDICHRLATPWTSSRSCHRLDDTRCTRITAMPKMGRLDITILARVTTIRKPSVCTN